MTMKTHEYKLHFLLNIKENMIISEQKIESFN